MLKEKYNKEKDFVDNITQVRLLEIVVKHYYPCFLW